jgi:hypothetical protein
MGLSHLNAHWKDAAGVPSIGAVAVAEPDTHALMHRAAALCVCTIAEIRCDFSDNNTVSTVNLSVLLTFVV